MEIYSDTDTFFPQNFPQNKKQPSTVAEVFLLVVVLPSVCESFRSRARRAHCPAPSPPAPRDEPDPHVILVQAHATPGPRGLRPLTKSERRQQDVDQR